MYRDCDSVHYTQVQKGLDFEYLNSVDHQIISSVQLMPLHVFRRCRTLKESMSKC